MAPRSLSPRQRRHVRQVIRDGHLAFAAEVLGPSAIDREDYDRLVAAGKIRVGALPQDLVGAAHAAGVSELDPGGHVVTEAERESAALIRDRLAQRVVDLGNRLDDAVSRILLSVDDDARRARLAGSTLPARDVAARVGEAASAVRRDWFRDVHTEVHNAAEEARAAAIAGRARGGASPRVFKRPHPDACAFCRLLYLRPDGVTPRVFELASLVANGTNAGRRAGRPTRSGRSRTQWRAVVGAAHPFCRCGLTALPDGMGFDAGGRLVYVGAKKSMSIEVDAPDRDLVNHACEE